jgi:hypothetical protein
MDLDDLEPVTEGLKKLRKAVHEFQGYIAVNKSFIPNYGDRYRHGESGRQPTDGETATDAVDAARCASLAPGADAGLKR